MEINKLNIVVNDNDNDLRCPLASNIYHGDSYQPKSLGSGKFEIFGI